MPAAQAVFVIGTDYQPARRGRAQGGYKFLNLFGSAKVYAKTAYPSLGKLQGFFYVALAEPETGMY